MSDKINKIVSQVDRIVFLLEEQNKAWSAQLELMSNALKMVDAKINAQQNTLKENPAIQQPTDPAIQTEQDESLLPGNVYGDTKPYGYEIEEQRAEPPQSFSGGSQERATQPQTQTQPIPADREPSGERVISLNKPKLESKPPMPQSKAEILAQQKTLPNQS